MSTALQLKKLKVLHDAVFGSDVYTSTKKDDMLFFPSGDGMCIGFMTGEDLPLLLSLQVQEKLGQYNRGKLLTDMVRVRIGLNNGNCFTFTDVQGRTNVWGPGVIIAKRIMDLGEADHILVGARFAEDLCEMSVQYRTILKPTRDYMFKHDIPMLIYSAYGENFGNPNPPKKDEYQKSRMQVEIAKLQNTTLYPEIDVSLTLKDTKTMLVQYTRKYKIQNISMDPISYVLHGIGLDVEKKSINDLKINCVDSAGQEMSISSVNLDKPYTKEFSTRFETPVKQDENRGYTITYQVEEPERSFVNAFAVECKNYKTSFSYPTNSIKEPILYDLNTETEEKTKTNNAPEIKENNGLTTISWKFSDVVKGQVFRLEW